MARYNFQESSWYSLLDENGKRLAQLSQELYERELRLQSTLESFSFIVFPMAKAYEGFIKLYLRKMGVLNRPDYNDAKFRIGRALNPDISDQQKNEWWLYDDIAKSCGDKIARRLWDTWVQCRNHVFHFYFDQENEMTLSQAEKKLDQMCSVMNDAMTCLLEEN